MPSNTILVPIRELTGAKVHRRSIPIWHSGRHAHKGYCFIPRAIKAALTFFLILANTCGPVLGQNSKEESKKHYEKGKKYYREGKYKESREEFQKALAAMPREEELIDQQPKALEYTIAEEDILNISVWQEKDLSYEVVVQPDGKISFPFIDEISVIGLTVAELKKEIVSRLKNYLKDPVVFISLKKMGGRRVILLGEVASPGVYPVSGTISVLELAALAGGFTQSSVLSSVILIRGGLKNPRGIRLNLTRAIEKAEHKQNIALMPGDIVYVPKKFIANVNYFVTQLVSPLAKGVLDTYDARQRIRSGP